MKCGSKVAAAHLPQLFETYPELFSPMVVDSLQIFSSKTSLSSSEIVSLAPFLESGLVKAYINLPSKDPRKSIIENNLRVYLESLGIYLGIKQPRIFQGHVFQLLGMTVKFTDSFSTLITKAQANIIIPKIEDNRDIEMRVDIQQMIKTMNNTICDGDVETFIFSGLKTRLIFPTRLLPKIIESEVMLHNVMSAHNWNNRIKVKGFIPLDSN
jgi:hypothetical protein